MVLFSFGSGRLVIGLNAGNEVGEHLRAFRQTRCGAGKLVVLQIEDGAVLHSRHIFPTGAGAISSSGVGPSPKYMEMVRI